MKTKTYYLSASRAFCGALISVLCLGFATRAVAQSGWVSSHQKISDTQGNFTGTLEDWENFGCAGASLGDLDGDGVSDLAVGAQRDDDGGADRGAVWVLFLDGLPCDACDMNCDGRLDAFDIEPFLDLLFDPRATPCDTCIGDVDGNGEINAFDIETFLECLFP